MKYIDADKLTKAIEDKGLDCSFALKMERLDILALIDSLRESEDKRRAEELIKALQSGYYEGYQHGKEDAQKEQKPAEWSEEDEEMLNSCISSIEESKENRYAYKENDGDTSYDREIAWLKSLRPQPKQEWSEEDEDKVVQYLHDRDGGMLWSKATEITRDILDILRP